MNLDRATIVANGEQKQVRLPCTLAGFLESCGLKTSQVVVERNGKMLARNELDVVTLKDGDRIEVILPVAGG